MRIVLIGLAVLAVVAAIGTYFLFQQFIVAKEDEQARIVEEMKASKTRILVADRPLPRGATVTSGILTWRPWPEDGILPDYIVQTDSGTDLDQQFVGSIVINGIGEGEPMTASKVFKRSGAGFLSGLLAPGMRAVSITTNATTAAAGFIRPNDRVDVLLTLDISRDASDMKENGLIAGRIIRYVAETFLHNIRVIAVDQAIADGGKDSGGTKVGKTVTVEVTPHQVEVIEVAKRMGTISLTLRSMGLEEIDEEKGTFTSDLEVSPTLATLFRDRIEGPFEPPPMMGQAPAPVEPIIRPSVPPPPPARKKIKKVKVYRGIEAVVEEGGETSGSEGLAQ